VKELIMRRVKVGDVMTRAVVSAVTDTPYKELVQLMSDHAVSGMPVLDGEGRLVGIVTEADLLLAEEGERHSVLLRWLTHPKRLAAFANEAKGVLAGHIMTRDVVTVGAHQTVRDAAKTLLEAQVKRLPVVDNVGRVVGIISRRDLLRPYLRSDDDIRDEVRADVLIRTMCINPATIRVIVDGGVVRLHGEVESKGVKKLIVELAHRVDGVVSVDEHLTVTAHDRTRPPYGPYRQQGWPEIWVPGSERSMYRLSPRRIPETRAVDWMPRRSPD
jgi:CBS-domain-containing membrane protein